MTQWYYADRNRQRQGPIEAAELAALFRRNEVGADTLVWREGLEQWQALGDFAGELGLLDDAADAAAVPEPPAVAPEAPAAGEEAAAGDGRAVFGAREPAYTAPERAYAEPSTPYAPPSASVSAPTAVVHGGEVVHAGLWKRFAANVIDSLITGVLSYAVLIPLMMIVGVGAAGLGAGPQAFGQGAAITMMLLVYPIVFTIPAVYFGWMQASSTQASLGKMAVGIKVVRGSGDAIGFWRGFLRNIAFNLFVLLTCGLGALISAFMAALTERKQAPHDMACDTLVVDKWAYTEHPEWQRRELGTVTIVILAIYAVLIAVVTIAVVAAIATAPR